MFGQPVVKVEQSADKVKVTNAQADLHRKKLILATPLNSWDRQTFLGNFLPEAG